MLPPVKIPKDPSARRGAALLGLIFLAVLMVDPIKQAAARPAHELGEWVRQAYIVGRPAPVIVADPQFIDDGGNVARAHVSTAGSLFVTTAMTAPLPVVPSTPFCSDDFEERSDGGLDFCRTYAVGTILEVSGLAANINYRVTPLPDAGFAAYSTDKGLLAGQIYRATLSAAYDLGDGGVRFCAHLSAADNSAGFAQCP